MYIDLPNIILTVIISFLYSEYGIVYVASMLLDITSEFKLKFDSNYFHRPTIVFIKS